MTDISDTLDNETKLTALTNKVNRSRRKSGLPEITVDIIRTEYTLAKEIEDAKVAGNLELVSSRMKDLIAHQKQYGL